MIICQLHRVRSFSEVPGFSQLTRLPLAGQIIMTNLSLLCHVNQAEASVNENYESVRKKMSETRERTGGRIEAARGETRRDIETAKPQLTIARPRKVYVT